MNKERSKIRSVILLSILSVIMAAVLVFTFLRFPVGISNYNSAVGAIDLDYDVEGGVAYTLTLADDNYNEVEDIEAVIKTFNYRLEKLGYKSFTVKALKNTDDGVKDYSIRIETKNTDSVSADIETVAKYGEVKIYGGTDSSSLGVICEDVKVINKAKYLGAISSGDQKMFGLQVEFTDAAFETLMKEIDKASSGYYIDIKFVTEVNGEESEESLFDNGGEPIQKSYFEDQSISAYLTDEAETERRALLIGDGGLAYKYEVDEGAIIDSPSGAKVALKALISVLAILVVFMALMLIMYKGLGVITSLSTLLFILGETWLMIGVPGITFSFGGLIGMIIATLLCAISMVVISKRVKEEFANSEKTAMAAIKKGFAQALAPTASIHVLAGIVAILLFAFTSGVVQCFAITMGIGVVVSLIASLGFTRMFSAIILPLADDKEKFLRFKRAEVESIEEVA